MCTGIVLYSCKVELMCFFFTRYQLNPAYRSLVPSNPIYNPYNVSLSQQELYSSFQPRPGLYIGGNLFPLKIQYSLFADQDSSSEDFEKYGSFIDIEPTTGVGKNKVPKCVN
jgi:hypothetical protein